MEDDSKTHHFTSGYDGEAPIQSIRWNLYRVTQKWLCTLLQ